MHGAPCDELFVLRQYGFHELVDDVIRLLLNERGIRVQRLVVVTIEPCAQCAGAIVLAKVKTLVFGAYDEKAGMCGSVGDIVRHPRLNHRVNVQSGVEAEACGELIRGFFAAKR